METSIEHLTLMYDELISSELMTFQEVKDKKNIMGVYVIYSHENELLYIGSTNNFYVRFGTDLRHESTHTLIKKLIKKGVHLDRSVARNFFTVHYKYKVHICQTKREAEALESLAIWMLNPIYNK